MIAYSRFLRVAGPCAVMVGLSGDILVQAVTVSKDVGAMGAADDDGEEAAFNEEQFEKAMKALEEDDSEDMTEDQDESNENDVEAILEALKAAEGQKKVDGDILRELLAQNPGMSDEDAKAALLIAQQSKGLWEKLRLNNFLKRRVSSKDLKKALAEYQEAEQEEEEDAENDGEEEEQEGADEKAEGVEEQEDTEVTEEEEGEAEE